MPKQQAYCCRFCSLLFWRLLFHINEIINSPTRFVMMVMIFAWSIIENKPLLPQENMITQSSIPEKAYKLMPVISTQIIPRTANNDINLGDDFILLFHFFFKRKCSNLLWKLLLKFTKYQKSTKYLLHLSKTNMQNI